mmetsp:Transcript_6992/g.24875  ORF Transcript_6992/g.24875 Transcript_6992/m.24875 type:complete len:412 (-) Transcript_6992:31-1266(-)
MSAASLVDAPPPTSTKRGRRHASEGDASLLVVVIDTGIGSWVDSAGKPRDGVSDLTRDPTATSRGGGGWKPVPVGPDAGDAAPSTGAATTGGAGAAPDGTGETASGSHTSVLPLAAHVSFVEAVRATMVLLNAFIALDRRNDVAVIANGARRSKFLYPKVASGPARRGASSSDFASPLESIHAALSAATIEGDDDSDVRGPVGSLSSSLARAMCFINRVHESNPKVQPRILVVQAADDSAPLYVTTMNCIFCCEKSHVPVDSCALTVKDSSILQQAAYKTSGVYFRPTKLFEAKGLAESMITLFLPDAYARGLLVAPLQTGVDMRAACFCHRKPQDQAYVCAVCLTIWCERAKECEMCGARAPRPGSATGSATLGFVPSEDPRASGGRPPALAAPAEVAGGSGDSAAEPAQ